MPVVLFDYHDTLHCNEAFDDESARALIAKLLDRGYQVGIWSNLPEDLDAWWTQFAVEHGVPVYDKRALLTQFPDLTKVLAVDDDPDFLEMLQARGARVLPADRIAELTRAARVNPVNPRRRSSSPACRRTSRRVRTHPKR